MSDLMLRVVGGGGGRIVVVEMPGEEVDETKEVDDPLTSLIVDSVL